MSFSFNEKLKRRKQANWLAVPKGLLSRGQPENLFETVFRSTKLNVEITKRRTLPTFVNNARILGRKKKRPVGVPAAVGMG